MTRGECFAQCERQGSVRPPYDTDVVDQGEERLAALWEHPLDEDVDAELADRAIHTLFATPDGADQPVRGSRRIRRGSGASMRDRRPCWRRPRTRTLRSQSTRRAVMVAGIGAAIMLPTGVVALTGSSETPPARLPAERVVQPAAQGVLPRRSADHRQSRAAPVQRRRGARRPPAVRRTRVHRASIRRRQRGARRDKEARAKSAAPRAQVIAPPPVPPASSACDEFPPC